MNSILFSSHPRLAENLGIDLRSLALFRFVLGLVLLRYLLAALPDAELFWSDWGIVPRALAMDANTSQRLSLYFLNGSTLFTQFLLLLQSVCALMFMLGWNMRPAAIASFVLWGSLMNRNSIVIHGGDQLMACLLFWSMFLPLSARFSVDAATASNPPPAENRYTSWATAGLLLQVMSVYFFSAILKNGSAWYPDYTAVYYALSLDGYALPLGQWLLNFPLLMKGLSCFVFWLEALGPILIFLGLRYLRFSIMLCFMAMHIGFIFCLAIGHFPFVSLASLCVFTGGWVWDGLSARHLHKQGHELRLYYDRDCGFCRKMCLLLQQFLVLPQMQISPAQDTPRAKALLEANYSWVVIDGDNQAHLKWAAFTILLRRSALFGWCWPLVRSPALERPGNAVYDFVGRHRGFFGGMTGLLLPIREQHWNITTGWDRTAGVFMLLVFIWNCTTAADALPRYVGHTQMLTRIAESTRSLLAPPLLLLRIDQRWNMFAPHPPTEDGWLVITGQLADGRSVNVLDPESGPPDYAKPLDYAQSHVNIRWHNWLERLRLPEFVAYPLYTSKYLCREWNRDKLFSAASRSQRLMEFRIVFVLEKTLPDYQPAQIEQQVLWRHECFTAKNDSNGTVHD